jgi:probable rRNA maturation factor
MPRSSALIQVRAQAGRFRFSQARLRSSAAKIMRLLGRKKTGLGIVLTDDAGIRELNRKYLDHDRPTDVIAFGYGKDRILKAGPFLGDVVISLATARREAKRRGISMTDEVHLYLCHGILHLLGYRDHNKKEKDRMWRKQDEVLKKTGLAKANE